MADLAATFLFYLRFANLLVAAYLLWFIYSLYRSHARSFSRTIKLMLVTMLLFFITETVQVFELIPAATFGLLQSVFAFFFLLLLLSALHEIRRSMLAHDHLVRRKFRGRLSDVE